MTGDSSGYAIDVDRLLGSENASRFDGQEHGVSVLFFYQPQHDQRRER